MSADGTAVIELRSLTKRYGRSLGVDGLDLDVGRGEVFGLLGPHGAGKTTTLRCLVGLLRPSAGAVRVLGLDPVADHRRVAPSIGYLPGELRLYPELTGRQTLDLLADLQGAPAPRQAELCDRLRLSRADLDKRVAAYSRGMKQKLGLVQALQHRPSLSVLLNAAATATVALGVTFSPDLRAAVPIGGVLAAGLLGCGFTLCLTGPVLAVSAAGRRRASVVGATVVLGAVGFALNFVGLAWEPAAPLRYLSPFHYYTPGDALARGTVPWVSLAVLSVVGLTGLAAAFVLLERRDLAA
ncbi:ABC transporter ATP-binding protein [Streptomyces sp. NRRL S-495]|uniref:ABC transporter ATP-binding protein n=1 Tax=Streptomyces sp. NRRL S-495 TaxID=1609133 RepID=UPI0006989CBF|nr:ABC transporter ATP-binding protein [Streptomyces sp. NRRL S-495]